MRVFADRHLQPSVLAVSGAMTGVSVGNLNQSVPNLNLLFECVKPKFESLRRLLNDDEVSETLTVGME